MTLEIKIHRLFPHFNYAKPLEYPKIIAPDESQTLQVQQDSPRKSAPSILQADVYSPKTENLMKISNLPTSIEIKTLIDPKDWWNRPNKHSTVIYHWRSMTITGDIIATTVSGQPSIQKIKCKDWIKVNFE